MECPQLFGSSTHWQNSNNAAINQQENCTLYTVLFQILHMAPEILHTRKTIKKIKRRYLSVLTLILYCLLVTVLGVTNVQFYDLLIF